MPAQESPESLPLSSLPSSLEPVGDSQLAPQDTTLPAVPIPSPAPAPVEDRQPQDPIVLRRSARSKTEPQRLNVESWHGKTYDAVTSQVGYVADGRVSYGYQYRVPSGYRWCYPAVGGQAYMPYFYMTAPNSVGHTYGLPPSVPGGGGGISGYGLPSYLMQSTYQTKCWPGPTVHNTGLSQAQHSYSAYRV